MGIRGSYVLFVIKYALIKNMLPEAFIARSCRQKYFHGGVLTDKVRSSYGLLKMRGVKAGGRALGMSGAV
jgi:hypothetical protein